MDFATRYQPRVRAQSYLDRERNTMPHDDSGTENESLPRRKFQRTTAETAATDPFRKPSLPASAYPNGRQVSVRRPSVGPAGGAVTGPPGSRRRSVAVREAVHVRVPSGPRAYPESPGKRFGSQIYAPSPPTLAETTNTAAVTANRFVPPQSTSEPLFGNNNLVRASFGNPSSSEDVDSPVTPAEPEHTNGAFDFVPTLNFDDLQNRLSTRLDGPTSALLGEFPIAGGGRALAKAEEMQYESTMAVRPTTSKQPGQDSSGGMVRSQSFSRRFTGGGTTRSNVGQPKVQETAAAPPPANPGSRTRRQSTMPQTSTNVGQPMPTNPVRTPRKSVGPGMFSGLMDRKGSTQQPAPTVTEPTKSSLARASSLSKARRITLGPAAGPGAEPPRLSTLTATTQSRQAKVKSLQPPPRDADPTAAVGRSPGKPNINRATTPSSGGNNKRQSMAASGRASGLGARTISPTDARRLKRMSMMQAPPMPTSLPMPKQPPPQSEDPPPTSRLPEPPRLTQPSPSLIPRKASTNLAPTSARNSPEPRLPFMHQLTTQSSIQSLDTSNLSTSRLPTPKTRNLHSSSAQYGEGEEMWVPPVPAIPKAYESPKEYELPFFSNLNGNGSRKSSFATVNSLPHDTSASLQPMEPPSRTSFELQTLETPRQAIHKRAQTIGSPKEAHAPIMGSLTVKQQPEATGRRNNNLQPLVLPPLNLLPLRSSRETRNASSTKLGDGCDDRSMYGTAQTPEPMRLPKTPSTPMTASKASFWKKQDEKNTANAARSNTSHHILRDMMGFDDSVTRFFDDSDPETSNGVPIPAQKLQQQHRNAITPFASGSLPKSSGEFAGLRGRASLEGSDGESFNLGAYENLKLQGSRPLGAPQGPRPRTSGTAASWKTAQETATASSPITDYLTLPYQHASNGINDSVQKKEGGGLRRKLSLGWRRSSSKTAQHPGNKDKGSPQAGSPAEFSTRPPPMPRASTEMPPPKLPASATWSGELPTLANLQANESRPSLDSLRRKSQAVGVFSNGHLQAYDPPTTALPDPPRQPLPVPQAKTRALHSEQPQPASSRSTSWGNFSFNNRHSTARPPVALARPKPAAHADPFSALVKDASDLAADDEMRRLSQKRREVDTAARETEELKRRALPRDAISPDQVLRSRESGLNIFERGEIIDFGRDGVYFTGTRIAKKIIGSVSPSPVTSGSEKDKGATGNFGYDDERGDYNIVFGDHLAYRYEVVDVLGKGSFGQVVRCVDHKEGGIVAVKIIRNKKRFHQQALVEVGILGRLGEWDPHGAHATLTITTSFYFRSHLCIVTPCLSISLYELIRSHNFTGFPLPLIRRFTRQLLACLVLLQTKRIIHCDLKPENILLCDARKADVRVIDFGSSCREEEKVYTYIQSRFYRSPEVILGSSYGLGIDMWSLGCILAELWTGYPIFPGENEQEQLACIMEIFGPPDRFLVERCSRKKLFFDSVGKPRVTVSSKGRRRRPSSRTLSQALKTDDEAFIDFIARCLRWDPDRRMKPDEAISHPFVTGLPMPSAQPQQRLGIPDEARRAARPRATGPSSPTKRTIQQQVPLTPKRLPTTNSIPAAAAQGSPAKPPTLRFASDSGATARRHSSITSLNTATTVAGSKRASNGAVLAGNPAVNGNANAGRSGLATLAAVAASSGSGTPGGGGRWRS
nr:hypothetical protein B0A51_11334 [Rachicladosporium sp. CCFEE 5018]